MAQELADVVRMIEADAGNLGMLSTGETIAAALALQLDGLAPSRL